MATNAAALVVIMSGGTGGHVFPGLAVAQRLKDRRLQDRAVKLLWLGTTDRLDSTVVPQAGIEFIGVAAKAFRGKGLLNYVLATWLFSITFWKVLLLFIKRRPALVLGMGGFVSVPGGVAAFILGIPLVIHEQNAVAGLSNRCLAPLSRRILCGFPDVFKSKRATWVGNPLRDEIKALATHPKQHAEQHTQTSAQQRLRVLVLGGSLGADFLNTIVPQALALIAAPQRPQVLHQTGKGHLAKTQQRIQEFKSHYQAFEFDALIHQRYRWADLIVCRAGAMTVAEVAAAARAAIFVPYPHAVDDHQSANARYLVAKDAALMVRQDQLTADKLADLLRRFISNREALAKMSAAAAQAAILNADTQIADICRDICFAEMGL